MAPGKCARAVPLPPARPQLCPREMPRTPGWWRRWQERVAASLLLANEEREATWILVIGFLFGQFNFFWQLEKKMLIKMGFSKFFNK